MIDEKKLIDELKQIGMIADNEYGNAMVDMINSQTKIGGWIPCSERLPDEWEGVMICYYNSIEEKYLLDIACLDGNGNWKLWRESGGYFPPNFKKKITHWRTLPDLPDECNG